MNCRFCGAELGSDAQFCERCGRQVGDKPIENLIGDSESPKANMREKSLLAPLLIFIISLVGLCLCVFFRADAFSALFAFLVGELSDSIVFVAAAFVLFISGAISLVKVIRRL